MLTIKVKYSCSLCGIWRLDVMVPARVDADGDVVSWMEKVMSPRLVEDHEARSPHCHPKKFSEVMIPITGADRVGGVAVN